MAAATLGPASAVVPSASVVRLASGVLLPTAARNRVVPLLLATSAKPPFTGPLNVMGPVPAVTVRWLSSASVLPNSTALFVVLSVAVTAAAPIVTASL